MILRVNQTSSIKPTQPTPSPASEVELQGRLRIIISDNFQDKISSTRYFLEVGSNTYALHFTKGPPPITPGSTIKVKGMLKGKDLFVNN